jgi:hypothetical protein
MRQWSGGADTRLAAVPRWAENSVGDRFFSQKWATDAARAPGLADVELPGRDVFAGDPGHWEAAMSVLFRGVVLDGVPVRDQAVSEILDMLAPVISEELAQIEEEEEEWGYFQETSGPLFLLGGEALTTGTWAIAGDDPVDALIDILERPIAAALAAAGSGEGIDAKAVAEVLILAMTNDFQFDEPADIEALERIGHGTSGNVLLDLIDAEQVAPEDALRLGLVILAALADLARTDKESILS